MKNKRPAGGGGQRESVTDFAIRAGLTYEQARRELLVGNVRGGRDGGGRLYVESRSADEFVGANTGTDSGETVSKEDAARMIGGGVSANRVNQLIKAGTLKTQYVNGEFCVTRDSVEAYIAKRDAVATPSTPIRL
jgi:hypothetical protein